MEITVTEFAKRAGVHPSAIRQAIQRGKLPARKSGSVWLVEDSLPYTKMESKVRIKP